MRPEPTHRLPSLPRRLRQAAAALLLPLGAACAAAPPPLLLGPYKDVSIGIDPRAPRIVAPAWDPAPHPLSWAFATGECGQERWGSFDTEAFARLNVEAARASGRRYIVSTGGEAGIFTCATDEGMARFVARYDSPQLVGFDFDIEGKQSAEQIDSLVQRLQALQQRRPALRLSFTLASFAASDGSGRSLNPLGERVLATIRRVGLKDAVLNLMVMNYGPANPAHCVVKEGRCDMAASALQAARNLQQKHGVPAGQIALTAMLGENDVQANVFTPADAETLLREARAMGLAGLHFWSMDRDQPCPAGSPRVSPLCHGLAQPPAGGYTRLLAPR